MKVNDLAWWKGTHVTGDEKEQYRGNYLCECGCVCGGEWWRVTGDFKTVRVNHTGGSDV